MMSRWISYFVEGLVAKDFPPSAFGLALAEKRRKVRAMPRGSSVSSGMAIRRKNSREVGTDSSRLALSDSLRLYACTAVWSSMVGMNPNTPIFVFMILFIRATPSLIMRTLLRLVHTQKIIPDLGKIVKRFYHFSTIHYCS
jgi:hypothetical protein